MRFPLTDDKLARCERLTELLTENRRDLLNFDALLDSVASGGRAVSWILKKEVGDILPEMSEWLGRELEKMGAP